MTKKYISAFIALEAFLGSFGSVVMAQGAASGMRPTRENACVAFTERIDAVPGKVGELREDLQARGEERKDKLEDRWNAVTEKREEGRARRDENIDARIT